MGSAGLLLSLQGQSNWDSIRQERQRELQLASLQSQLAKQDFTEHQQAAQQMQDYLSTVGKIKVLDPAIKGIQDREEELSKKVLDGLYKSRGDAKKYLAEGGVVDMQQYKDNLLNDPLVAKGVMSSANYNRAIADKQAGLVTRGTFDEDVAKYFKGEIDALPYQGAYKRPDFGGMGKMYSEMEGTNPYKSEVVRPERVYIDAVAIAEKQGSNYEDARDAANKFVSVYSKGIDSGAQGFNFKTRQYHIPSGWENGQNAYISARANLDQWDAVMNKDYNGWSAPKQAGIYRNVMDASGKMIKKGNLEMVTMQTADMIPVPLDKKPIIYKKRINTFDAKGNTTGFTTQNVTEEIQDAIEAPIKIEGKIYFQTTADRLQGKMPQPLESKTFNKVLMSLNNTPAQLRVAAAFRKAAAEKGVLNDDGTLNFDLNNQQSSSPQKGDTQAVQGGTAIFDGTKWVMQ